MTVGADLEPLAEAKGVELRLGRLEATRISGRAQALYTLVRNLVDNAIRHAPAGSSVRVAVEADGIQPHAPPRGPATGHPGQVTESGADVEQGEPGSGSDPREGAPESPAHRRGAPEEPVGTGDVAERHVDEGR